LFRLHHVLSVLNTVQLNTNRNRKKINNTRTAKRSTKLLYASVTTAILLIFSTFAFASLSISSDEQQIRPAYALPESGCITYDATTLTITVSCSSPVSLTDIYEQLGGAENKALYKDPDNNDGVWLLNANVTILAGSTLNIDSSKDTTWLKIVADGTIAYPIEVFGGLKIDSVKVTSWNPETNDYAQSYGSRETSGKITHPGAPRPYIRVEKEATGTTDITNSEIAYLGYEGGWGTGTSGIHYHLAGHGSVIRNNDIHHLYFGFYSVGVGGMVIENNKVHDMGHYGIDPHTGTHDMVIRNNTVYGNNGTAIICSQDCYKILFEKNVVYNNNGAGIAFSRNVTNSIAKDNNIYDQSRAIHVSQSHNNEVYNNTISNAKSAIAVISNSSANNVHDNNIRDSSSPLRIDPGLDQVNRIYSNNIENSSTSSTPDTSSPDTSYSSPPSSPPSSPDTSSQ
jgi:poly(beta-D-mannuronate) C5 epimerase